MHLLLHSPSVCGVGGLHILFEPRAQCPALTSRQASQRFSSSVLFTLSLGFHTVHLKEQITSSSQVVALEAK